MLRDELSTFLPEAQVGVVQDITPISLGLSGAGVYAVTASRGAFVLRVQPRQLGDGFAQQLRVQRRAADAEIAPALVHVDEAVGAVVSQRIAGMPVSAALANPADRPRVLGSVIEQLRRLHALDTTDITPSDPLAYGRNVYEAQRNRPGFPAWANDLEASFAAVARALEADQRRTLSHNDANPGNVLWDGQRAWLVDWEASGIGHPYYDLATLALFLRLDEQTALALAAAHDGAPLNDTSRATFRALFKFAGLLSGTVFLGLVNDLSVYSAPTLADAPTLGQCYEGLRSGQLQLQSPQGQMSFGLALLAIGVAAPLS